jgi:predicted nuclease of restriction endonuclease-like (RecB) superfamily
MKRVKNAGTNNINKDYIDFLSDVKRRIVSARVNAFHAVNQELLGLYWSIGKSIVEQQEKHKWGNSVVEKLAVDLSREFSGVSGYSAKNLWRMRLFYLAYKNNPKLARLVREIPWGQNIVILQMVKDDDEREYYIRATAQMGWSRKVLLNQIKAGAYRYQKTIPKQHNFSKVLPAYLSEQADESLRSVYSLDFLGIAKPVLERELERRLVEKVKHFMLELGKGFTFIGNQHRLVFNGKEYFIDLLFFNRVLKCLVAVELKTGEFEIEHAAKMDLYLDLLNDQSKFGDENPSIGIILCVKKDSVEVEYSMKRATNPMGVAEYRLAAKPSKELRNILPDEQDMRRQLLIAMKADLPLAFRRGVRGEAES